MALPVEGTERDIEGDSKLGEIHACRPQEYFFAGKELAQAGLRYRAIALGFHYRGQEIAPCAWCGGREGECGVHLLVCPDMPEGIKAARDAALKAVYKDHEGREPRHRREWDRMEVHDRLLTLRWSEFKMMKSGHPVWKGSKAVMRQVLRYMRDAINAYHKSITEEDGSQPGRDHPLYPVPVYKCEWRVGPRRRGQRDGGDAAEEESGDEATAPEDEETATAPDDEETAQA
jgi:hypothetical protein